MSNGLRLIIDLANNDELKQYVKDVLFEGAKSVTREEVQTWINSEAKRKLEQIVFGDTATQRLIEEMRKALTDRVHRVFGAYELSQLSKSERELRTAMLDIVRERVDTAIAEWMGKIGTENVKRVAAETGERAAREFLQKALKS